MPTFYAQRFVAFRRSPSSLLVPVLLIFFCLPASLSANEPLNSTDNQSTIQLLPELTTPVMQASQHFHGQDLVGKDGPLEKLGYDLAQLYAEFQVYQANVGEIAAFQSAILAESTIHTASGDYVVIDAIATENAPSLLVDLQMLGLLHGESFGSVVSGHLPISMLADIAGLANLRFAHAALVEVDTGAAISQADRAMDAETARTQLSMDGTGIRVGVLSDSYDCLEGESDDLASGDVPPDVMVLAEEIGCVKGQDEGRALVQVVADIAPGATQAFHTAFGGQAVFANGIVELGETAQVDVIVDDVRYLMEPMFQDGILAQAVDQVVAAGIPYFASAGNNARQAYESPFVTALNILPIDLPLGVLHDFDPGSGIDVLQKVTIPVGTTATFNLQWDQPYASATGGNGATSDLDMLLLGLNSTVPLAVAIDKNIGRDPIEILRFTNPGPGTTFDLAIVHIGGPKPTRMKYIYTGNNLKIEEYATQSGTVYGHASAVGARAVGAAFYLFTPAYDTVPPVLELSSSVGPTTIFYDEQDVRVNDVRQKPEIVAPDGINTTFFGEDIADPGDGSDLDSFPNFFGTSAAAPNAAAVAALLLAVKPTLTPSQVYALLETHAIDMGADGVDHLSGHGLIQTRPALEQMVNHDLVITQRSLLNTALPGQWVDYEVTVTNVGPNPTSLVYMSNHAAEALHDVGVVAGTDLTIPIGNHATWGVNNLESGHSQVVTIIGRVDSSLNTDTDIVNETMLTSVGDNHGENNQSQASVVVHVPRVQFTSDEAEGEADGNRVYRIAVDVPNPYAPVILHYSTSSSKPDTSFVPVTGVVTMNPGETATTITVSNNGGVAAVGETITLQLRQPKGAQLGKRTTVVIVSNPDGDQDGVPDDDDEAPVDGCIPNTQADGCDQEPDGLTNADERLHNTDPTNPDSDADGVLDGDEVKNGSEPLDHCDPTPNESGCVPDDGDDDGDDDDDDGNPGGVGEDEDTDGDGTRDDQDFAPLNPCMPNQNSPACKPTTNPDGSSNQLYLPGIRGRSTSLQ